MDSPHYYDGEMSKDITHSQDHYKQTDIEPIEVIEEYNLNFCLGNAIKYILRADYKGSKIADLEKARWYIERELMRIDI
jgi:hypothetical protein